MIEEVNVQARNCEIDDGARAHFEDKLHGLERLWSRGADAQVRITLERGLYAAEITLFADGLTTRAEERTHDLRAAFDAAIHKLESQLRRYKDKVQQRARRQNNRDDVSGTVLHPIPAPGLTAPATVAALESNSQNGNASEAQDDKMVRVKKFALKPMAAEEAVLQMDLLGHDFFVFRDDENNQVSVVYRRSGGGYGLIEPVPD